MKSRPFQHVITVDCKTIYLTFVSLRNQVVVILPDTITFGLMTTVQEAFYFHLLELCCLYMFRSRVLNKVEKTPNPYSFIIYVHI